MLHFYLFFPPHLCSRSAAIRDPALRASICTALLTREKCKSPRKSSWTKPKNMFLVPMCWKGHGGVWDGVKALNRFLACCGELNRPPQRGRHNNSAARVNINVHRQDSDFFFPPKKNKNFKAVFLTSIFMKDLFSPTPSWYCFITTGQSQQLNADLS